MKSEIIFEQNDNHLILGNSFGQMELSTSGELKARKIINRLANKTVDLGNGLEFGIDIDTTEDRLTIGGWRGVTVRNQPNNLTDDQGMLEGYFEPGFNDFEWQGKARGIDQEAGGHDGFGTNDVVWRRTHIVIPKQWEGRPAHLVLGGFGLFDYQDMRVFFNGKLIDTRKANPKQRWRNPGTFDIGSGSKAHQYIRFGTDNVIAMQLRGNIDRTTKLDSIDPSKAMHLPWQKAWPAQFEQYLYSGPLLTTPKWEVKDIKPNIKKKRGKVIITLKSKNADLTVEAIYQWHADKPAIHQQVKIHNDSKTPKRVLHIRQGSYITTTNVSEGEQGFPVHIDGHTFMSLAHPSGWAKGQQGSVELIQYPGEWIQPGQKHQSMERVIGFAPNGQSVQSFVKYIQSRMRRVKRGHEKSISIFDSFGSWELKDKNNFLEENNDEPKMLNSISWQKRLRDEADINFDIQNTHFWVNPVGSIKDAEPTRYPNGFKPIYEALHKIDSQLGLWLDSSMCHWSIGANPISQPCLSMSHYYNHPKGWVGSLCRATEPIKSLYTDAYMHHLRENNVKLCKFDNFFAWCTNPEHDHMPGIYSTQAIQSAAIDFLETLDKTDPDVFLMLYWGYRSPWWLLYGDTLFEPGLLVEAASPGSKPTPFARNGVTRELDVAHQFAKHIPSLGKDSLGIWLSDWGWNSSIGREAWQDAFVMDMARGNLLPQIWSDDGLLNKSQRRELAMFMKLSQHGESAWKSSSPVVGMPANDEPYGYCCSDGEKAYLVIHNATWRDEQVQLELADNANDLLEKPIKIYRLYPRPALLSLDSETQFESLPTITMRPFETVLLEIVPNGDTPSIERRWKTQAISTEFSNSSKKLKVKSYKPKHKKETVTIKGAAPIPPDSQGIGVITCEHTESGVAVNAMNPNQRDELTLKINGQNVRLQPVLGDITYPVPWQAWRFDISASGAPVTAEWKLSSQDTTSNLTVSGWCIEMRN